MDQRRDIDFLQQQFLLKYSRKEASRAPSYKLSRLHGVWLQGCRQAGRSIGLLLDKLRRFREAKGTESKVALVIFAMGAVLFLLTHGHELFAGPRGSLSFLARFVGYGLFLGVPFIVARMRRSSGVLVATLLLLAAGFDLGGKVYVKMLQESKANGLPAMSTNQHQPLPKVEKQLHQAQIAPEEGDRQLQAKLKEIDRQLEEDQKEGARQLQEKLKEIDREYDEKIREIDRQFEEKQKEIDRQFEENAREYDRQTQPEVLRQLYRQAESATFPLPFNASPQQRLERQQQVYHLFRQLVDIHFRSLK